MGILGNHSTNTNRFLSLLHSISKSFDVSFLDWHHRVTWYNSTQVGSYWPITCPEATDVTEVKVAKRVKQISVTWGRQILLIDLLIGIVDLILCQLLIMKSLMHVTAELHEVFQPSSSGQSSFMVPSLANMSTASLFSILQ